MSWPYAREGGPVKTEEDSLDPDPLPTMRETLAAIRHLEQTTVDAGGTVLRYSGIYGPPDDTQLEAVRKRRFPIIGDGAGITSFVHLDDAAAATVLAVEASKPGIYNVVTTNLRPCASGCRRSRPRSARSRRDASRAGSHAGLRARRWS
jgi:nucleoside-diphosphate-sugar epimerase